MVSAMNLHPLTPEQKNEYTRIAYCYYEAGQTQDQIAQRLGISLTLPSARSASMISVKKFLSAMVEFPLHPGQTARYCS